MMKKFFALTLALLLALAMALSLAACGGGSDSSGDSQPSGGDSQPAGATKPAIPQAVMTSSRPTAPTPLTSPATV